MHPHSNSRVGFGTAALHHLGNQRRQIDLLQAAADAGIRYFDTAPLYGHGSTERVLGKFLRKTSSQLTMRFATKFGLVPNPLIVNMPSMLWPYMALRTAANKFRVTPSHLWHPKRNFSPHYLRCRVSDSLRSMNLNNLDIVLIHEPTLLEIEAIEDTINAMYKLKNQGLVRAFGVSAAISVARNLTTRFPDIIEVAQVEVPQTPSIDDKLWIEQHADVTFGHFRRSRTQASGQNQLQLVVQQATQLSKNSTLLFSSRKRAHIFDFTTAVYAADSTGTPRQ